MRVVINHLCGHPFAVNVLSAAALEHERQLIENTRCLLCEVESEREAIERVESLFGCVALTGTPRQIAYARKLRYNYFKALLSDPSLFDYFDVNYEALEHKTFFSILALPGQIIESEWWITHRLSSTAETYYQYALYYPSKEDFTPFPDVDEAYAERNNKLGLAV